MSLFIRDPRVDALAEEVRRLSHTRTKTEAVRQALQARLDEIRRAQPIGDRLQRARGLVAAMGPKDPTFDMKTFTDAMWDEL